MSDENPFGPMREKMVDAFSEFLDIPRERASAAMHHAWEVTKDVKEPGSSPPSYTPDLSNSGVALAHRVELAMAMEFSGEDMFPAVVVVQSRDGHIGIASMLLSLSESEWLLRLGIGAVRRSLRQHGEPE